MAEGTFPIARAASSANDPSQATSGGTPVGTAGVNLKATAGRLYHLAAYNKSGTAYILMVFNKATAPVNSDAPVLRKHIAAHGDCVIGHDELGEFGQYFSAGIGIAISSTDDTLTLAVSDDMHFHALYK